VRAHGPWILGASILALACRTSEPSVEGTPATEAEAPPVASAKPSAAPPSPTPARTDGSARAAEIERALARIDAESLRADVEALAADSLQGRATPSPGLDTAAAHIVARARDLGLASPPGVTDHRQTFACGGPSRQGMAANVLAETEHAGANDTRVIVSAHYDHIGVRAGEGDGVWNGANDDASGVAAALAIAGAVAQLDPPPRRAVMLVAFCGEEIGLLGSKHFVAEPPVPLDSIAAAVNLEMLGRPSADARTRAWITGRPLSTMGDTFSAVNEAAGVTFVDGVVVGAQEGNAFDRSDNYPLARAGIVAHSVSTGRIDALYHSPDDEADTLDYDAMVPIVRAIARGVIAIAEAEDPPQWTPAGIAAGYTATR
jgi:Zn-dependent M28 family amino/carboxypeptidase